MSHVFAITGGIGTGKSTVAARFRERGLPVVDADALAREVVAPGSVGLAALVARFGAEIAPGGGLDRRKLGERVFACAEDRAALEAITHPLIRALAQRRFDELAACGEPLIGYEVPLLFEVGLDRLYRPVLLVAAPDALQLERAMRRDGATAEAVEARRKAQLPLEEKRRRADYVVENDGELATLQVRSDAALATLARALGVDPSRYGL